MSPPLPPVSRIVYKDISVDHLPHIKSFSDISGLDYSPDIVWIFDLDKHGFWWGNSHALSFWGLDELQQLIDKDLSADTEGARKRTEQTFVRAAVDGLTLDPWTTYPGGVPKLMFMRHKAVLLGEYKHRGIIAFISEQLDNQHMPENLLFAEAARYTSAAVSCYDENGKLLFENPAYTACYSKQPGQYFVDLFAELSEGQERLTKAENQQECRQQHLMKTKHGVKRHIVDTRNSRHPLTGEYVFLVTEYDVTELHETIGALEEAKSELKQMAYFDPLTNLPSLRLLMDKILAATHQAEEQTSKLAVLFIDLDGFKSVNDSCGHKAGDQLLIGVAQRLKDLVRTSDTVGRLGGDEFIICLTGINQGSDANRVAEQVIEALHKPFQVLDADKQVQEVTISASVGIAMYPECGQDVEQLLTIADKRMYDAKRAGKNTYRPH